MRIYLSGKMTGLPDLGRNHFDNTHCILENRGHVVLNPGLLPIGLPKGQYMPMCLAMLEAADAIYMLHGWEDSPGACLEHDYAAYQNKMIYYEDKPEDRAYLYDKGAV